MEVSAPALVLRWLRGRLPAAPSRARVPTPAGGAVLAFAFLALAEYWLAPPFFGITNIAATWSLIGNLLLLLLAGSVGVTLLVPLVARLRPLLVARRDRALFHGLWVGGLLFSLVATNSIQAGTWGLGAGSGAWETVYTPFGAWPTLAFSVPPLGFFGFLNVESVTVFGLLAVLWASVLMLDRARRAARCALPASRPRTWAGRVAAAAVWGPLGFLTSCPSCVPAYLALLGAFAPGLASQGYAAIPLAPWIGLAGLLYLASFVLAAYLLRRLTSPDPAAAEPTAFRDLPSTEPT